MDGIVNHEASLMSTKHLWAVVLSILTINSCLLITLTQPARAKQIIAQLTDVKDHVDVIKGDKSWQSATVGMLMNTGDFVRTGPLANAEITFRKGLVLELAGNAIVRIGASRHGASQEQYDTIQGELHQATPGGSAASVAVLRQGAEDLSTDGVEFLAGKGLISDSQDSTT